MHVYHSYAVTKKMKLMQLKIINLLMKQGSSSETGNMNDGSYICRKIPLINSMLTVNSVN